MSKLRVTQNIYIVKNMKWGYNMKVLKLGDEGIGVQQLTLALGRAGFSAGGIKNTFDNSVHRALVAFQNNVGISADGIAGEITYSELMPYLLGYTTLTLEEGQTPESVARDFGTTPEAIRIANPYLTSFVPGANITVPFGFDVVPSNVDYSYELTKFIADGLKARYPFITVESAGESVMEKDLTLIRIGSGNRKVFYNASHHANEWITTPVLLKFAEEYLKALTSGGNIASAKAETLYTRSALTLMPLVNPDGMDLVTGAIPVDSPYYLDARNIAASYPNIEFPSGWKANIKGTDLNLNYPAMWERAKEIKYSQGYTTPAPRDFVGASPLSEPESRSVYNLSAKDDYVLTVSLHTQGEVIYWKYLDFLPPRSEEIADALAEVSGYTKEITPYASGFAGYKDWFISYYNRPGYTIEIGKGQNPLPISDFDSIYPNVEKMLVKALELA